VGLYPDVLHDNVDVVMRLHHIVQADDVGVSEQPQDFYLPPHCNRGVVLKNRVICGQPVPYLAQLANVIPCLPIFCMDLSNSLFNGCNRLW
jgi:hypothetical protein